MIYRSFSQQERCHSYVRSTLQSIEVVFHPTRLALAKQSRLLPAARQAIRPYTSLAISQAREPSTHVSLLVTLLLAVCSYLLSFSFLR